MAVWVGEEVAELEEEEEVEEEEESLGNLDEEEIKKMQSDEVCWGAGAQDPWPSSIAEPLGVGSAPSSSPLTPRAQQAWR